MFGRVGLERVAEVTRIHYDDLDALAARAEGLGMGWVSLFDPIQLAELLHMPVDSKPIAILCLGHVEAFYPAPMLKLVGWADERPLDELVFHNTWGNIEK